jgi:hypothetical protein
VTARTSGIRAIRFSSVLIAARRCGSISCPARRRERDVDLRAELRLAQRVERSRPALFFGSTRGSGGVVSSPSTGAASSNSSAASSPTASAARLLTRATTAEISPPSSDGGRPICHMFTRCPSRLVAAGAIEDRAGHAQDRDDDHADRHREQDRARRQQQRDERDREQHHAREVRGATGRVGRDRRRLSWGWPSARLDLKRVTISSE